VGRRGQQLGVGVRIPRKLVELGRRRHAREHRVRVDEQALITVSISVNSLGFTACNGCGNPWYQQQKRMLVVSKKPIASPPRILPFQEQVYGHARVLVAHA